VVEAQVDLQVGGPVERVVEVEETLEILETPEILVAQEILGQRQVHRLTIVFQ
jgi:hypothetical protein